MKNSILILVALFFIQSSNSQEKETVTDGMLMKIKAKPSKGFNYDYYIFIPANIKKKKAHYLLVEPNNTGYSTNSMEEHDKAAKILASGEHFSIGNFVSKKIGTPLLVPIFPRPKEKPLTYTHALDRDAMGIKNVKYQRLDLQLKEMIKDAKNVLNKNNFKTHEKIFMNGFSASGSFVNRFAFLHPEIIKALATGGLNGILMLPQKQLAGEKLIYPLGIYDIKIPLGKEFDYKAYKDISQFIYMGKKDTNDAVKFDDAYGDEEREIIHKALSKNMLPDRWEICQTIYKLHKLNVEFRTYEHIGHGTPGSVLWEIVEFFRRSERAK